MLLSSRDFLQKIQRSVSIVLQDESLPAAEGFLGGKVIPRETKVSVFVYGLHHDPKIYPHPENFILERFAGATDRSPYAYIPFSAGSRNCIGNGFANRNNQCLTINF